ncbi:AAA ATPase, central region [Gloeomargarita lithophora Alchichica-D10]|uniref:Uncharacterized AAA domain-containing protein ycf46 n=1 Tax=Gloeomargarita lithophora Alchichica-D10 TaxID=1188229 RepID=A0A1J0AD57_9CYAN|nr:AAA family ATPase [Gloeomargarita lithophora]APB33869.1 AAA ATPase, central region [Gloeomargarita lithophora Alchichica-D10]
MSDELVTLLKAQYPLIYVVTPEEERAEQWVVQAAQESRVAPRVFTWTVTHGLLEYGHPRTNSQHHNTVSPETALDWVIRHKEAGVFIFKDLHPFTDSPAVNRWLRDAVASFRGTRKTVILLSPVLQVPVELEKEVVVLDFALPSVVQLGDVLAQQLALVKQTRLDRGTKEKLIAAAQGLTQDEAEKVFRKAQVRSGRLTEAEVAVVVAEKKQLIRRNGILEYIEEEATLEQVGGLDELKRWLRQRSQAFTERARLYGLPQPKGMLILGVPGCGKSLIAKTTSRLWELPLLRLDMGRIYDGSTVGRSEANLRSALKTAESIAPVILFIDELDKAFAGSAGSADSDGGTSSRIFGSFLTWMQDKSSPVFVMATANRVDKLPGEFLRKGRFDEIFFVDLPNQEERREIFRIHLAQRRPEIDRFDLEQLAKVSDGFSGAEIEQAVIAAMYDAFAQDREFTQLDIIAAVKATLPLSRTMTEQVTALRDWAKQRARPAAASVAEYQRLEF